MPWNEKEVKLFYRHARANYLEFNDGEAMVVFKSPTGKRKVYTCFKDRLEAMDRFKKEIDDGDNT